MALNSPGGLNTFGDIGYKKRASEIRKPFFISGNFTCLLGNYLKINFNFHFFVQFDNGFVGTYFFHIVVSN